jgi:hypothetical protein
MSLIKKEVYAAPRDLREKGKENVAFPLPVKLAEDSQ